MTIDDATSRLCKKLIAPVYLDRSKNIYSEKDLPKGQKCSTTTKISTSLSLVHLRIVGRGGDNGIASHGHILDNNCSSDVRSRPDPSSAGSNPAANFEKVVRLPGRCHPRLSLIGADLELGSPALCIDDLGGEPVLTDTTLHVDLEIA